MEAISEPDLDFGVRRPRFGSSSGRDLVLIFSRNLPGPVLAFNRWEMARSLISSGTVNLQPTSISNAVHKAEISDEILTVATRNSTLFFTGTGASPMPKARAASLPEAVCTNLKPDNVRSPPPPQSLQHGLSGISPGINGESNQSLILEMHLPHEIVSRGLGDAIRTHRHRSLLHATDAPNRRPQHDKFRLRCFLEKR